MSLTPEQSALAEAYQQVPQAVVDDLSVKARAIGEPLVRVGWQDAVFHILTQRAAKRRDAARPRKESKG